jgi:spore germination protein
MRRVGEWTAHLPDGSTVWWSDARSYAVRARLAASLHLHGLAVWSLGLSDVLAP